MAIFISAAKTQNISKTLIIPFSKSITEKLKTIVKLLISYKPLSASNFSIKQKEKDIFFEEPIYF